MDRILNMFANRSVRRFTALSLLCMLLCTLGSWMVAERHAKQTAQLLLEQELQIAGKLEREMPDAAAQIRTAVLTASVPEDLARGEALLGAYGLRAADTPPEILPVYSTIRNQTLATCLSFGMLLSLSLIHI